MNQPPPTTHHPPRLAVVLFHGIQAAMRAEKVLKLAGHGVKLVPTPRQFSSDCGVALRFSWAEHEQVRTRLVEAQVEIEAIHLLE